MTITMDIITGLISLGALITGFSIRLERRLTRMETLLKALPCQQIKIPNTPYPL